MNLTGVARGKKGIQYYVPPGTAIELWDFVTADGAMAKNVRNVKTTLSMLLESSDLAYDPSGRYCQPHPNWPADFIFDVKNKPWNHDGVFFIRIPNESIEMRFPDI
jgi:hypothetical protein